VRDCEERKCFIHFQFVHSFRNTVSEIKAKLQKNEIMERICIKNVLILNTNIFFCFIRMNSLDNTAEINSLIRYV
jgi:hypothetical protein